MWIKVLKSEFMEVLNVVGKAIKARAAGTTLPVLSGIYLEAKGGKIKAFSTSLDISLIKTINANVLSGGKVVVPARYFIDVVKSLPEVVLELKSGGEGKILDLTCDGNQFSFNTFHPEEFPREPERPGKGAYFLSIDSQTLVDLLQSVVRSASRDEARPNLNGVYIKLTSDYIEACATDTYRLALRKSPVKESLKEGQELLIPAAVVEETIKLLAETEGEVKVYFLENQLLVESNDFTEFIRLIDGQFPSYQGLIPEETETQLILGREELIEALKRLQVFSVSAGASTIELRITEGKVSLAAGSQEVGKGQVELEAEINGPQVTLGFNLNYLQDGLRAMRGEKVRIGLQSGEKPALLSSPEDENFFYLVMPVRMA